MLLILYAIIDYFSQSFKSLVQWLQNDFLKYLDHWEESTKKSTITSTGAKLSPADQKKMCLSEETLEGIRITG